MSKGFFIALEGLEGCGKSTSIKYVQDILEDMGYETCCTREPGGTKSGEHIRSFLLDPHTKLAPATELMLMNAARAQLCAELIRPKLDQGICVISDRFSLSTIAYQGHGRGINLSTIEQLNNTATGLLKPDLTILLDVPLETSLRRMHHRNSSDRIEQESKDFFKRVREGYLLAARQDKSIAIVDADCSISDLYKGLLKTLTHFVSSRKP